VPTCLVIGYSIVWFPLPEFGVGRTWLFFHVFMFYVGLLIVRLCFMGNIALFIDWLYSVDLFSCIAASLFKEKLQRKWNTVWYFHVKYFTSQLFCVNILWAKAINKITAREIRTSLCKYDVIKVCSIEYITTQIELVLPTFFQLLDRSQNYRNLTLGLLSSLWNIYHSITAYFFDPPCTIVHVRNTYRVVTRQRLCWW